MITASEFRVAQVMASAFFPPGEFRMALVMAQMLESWAEIYDADPVSIPMPEDAPHEIPSVILSRSDNSERLELSRGRVNLHRLQRDGQTVNHREALTALAARIATFTEVNRIPIGRLAAVVTRVAERGAPGRAIAEQYCRPEWLAPPAGPWNRPEGFEIHAHKTYELMPGSRVNSWVRIKTAKAAGHTAYGLITVQQDINTLAEELTIRQYAEDEVRHWFELASAEVDSILDRYFPPANTATED